MGFVALFCGCRVRTETQSLDSITYEAGYLMMENLACFALH
mgnify:CR=1 FL=1